MAQDLKDIWIVPVAYDNEPFVRTLFAQVSSLEQPDGGEYIKWVFDTSVVWAANTNTFQTYESNTLGTFSNLSAMTFYLSAETYDHTQGPAPIRETDIQVVWLTGLSADIDKAQYIDFFDYIQDADEYTIKYDLFPKALAPDIFVNYESTEHAPSFYRVKDGTTYTAQVSTVVDRSLLSLTNFLPYSEDFSTWTSNNITTQAGTEITPAETSNSTFLTPTSTLPFNTIKSIRDVYSASLPDSFLSVDNTYVIPMSGYTTSNDGVSAIFTVVVDGGAVSGVEVTNGGAFFNYDDTIFIIPTALGLDINSSTISFAVEDILNAEHFLSKPINLEEPETYTFSVFVRSTTASSGNQHLYIDGFNQEPIIFDVDRDVVLNLEDTSWDSVEIASFDPTIIQTPENTLQIQLNGNVKATVLSGDNLIIGGNFTTCNGTLVNGLCVINKNGNVISTFGTGVNGSVNTLDIDITNQRLYVGGSFSYYSGSPTLNAVAINLNNNSKVFSTDTNGEVIVIKKDPYNDRIFMGGNFTAFKGETGRNGFAAFNSSGDEYTAFNITDEDETYGIEAAAGTGGVVQAIAFFQNGDVLLGGKFAAWGGYDNTRNIAYLNSAGSVYENVFSPGFDGPVNTIVLKRDESDVYIGGSFNYYNEIVTSREVTVAVGGGKRKKKKSRR